MSVGRTVLHLGLGLMILVGLGSPAESEKPEPANLAAEEVDEGSEILAVVNGEPLYSPSLEQGLSSMHAGQVERARNDFDLRHLLDRVIDTLLIAQEARALGMDEEEPIPLQLEALRQKSALERLQTVEISDQLKITEEDVRGVFDTEYQTATIRMITLHEEEEAEALIATLDDGSDFEALAKERSKDQFSARGGLIENVDRIDLPRSVASSIFTSTPGSILGPLQTTVGWAIVRIEELAPANPERFDSLEKKCRDEIRARKAALLKKELSGGLLESHSVSIDWELVNSIGYKRLPDGRLRPEIANPAATVATIGDHEITAGALGYALQRRWSGVRNEDAAMASKPIVIQALVEAQLLKAEALSRGYDKTPETERAVAAFETHLLAKRYLDEVLSAAIEIKEPEIVAYYEEHRDAFHKPPRVQVGQITVSTREEADRIAELLRQGTDLAWLAREHSIDRLRDSGGDRGWFEPRPGFDPIQDALFTAQAGDVVGPMGPPGNLVVMRVGAREDQGFLTLEEARGRIKSALFREKFEESRSALIETLRERSEIEINDAALEALTVSGSPEEEDEPTPSHGH